MILPLRVLGSIGTNVSSPMTASAPSSSRTVATSSRRSPSDGCRPCLSTTNAAMTSPRSSSGRPVAPASATAGWRRIADSTSIVPRRCAAILMISSARPRNQAYPSSSMSAESPVE